MQALVDVVLVFVLVGGVGVWLFFLFLVRVLLVVFVVFVFLFFCLFVLGVCGCAVISFGGGSCWAMTFS